MSDNPHGSPQSPEAVARVGATRLGAAMLGLYFAGFLFFAIFTERGLVADGGYYFLAILRQREVVSPEISRWAANFLTQWPVLVALWCGVADLRVLSYLHSFGLFYLSVVTLALSWRLLASDRKFLFILPFATLVFGWLASCYAAISQAQVLALWFWPAASLYMLATLVGRAWRL